MNSEIKPTVEVDLTWVVGLFNYIDPPPITLPDGTTKVFINPDAARALAMLSEHVRKFKAVPKSAEQITESGRVAMINILRREIEESRKFIADAFKAHPNLDLDIEMVRKNGL